ncbi:MAG TPA: DUF4160 domain-containing protein [Stellaceae bacterium]|nr:DUF4160 domain-containing protein [Stellaceae bacterium]
MPEAYSRGFDARELRHIRRLVEAHREQIQTAWDEHFD